MFCEQKCVDRKVLMTRYSACGRGVTQGERLRENISLARRRRESPRHQQQRKALTGQMLQLSGDVVAKP